MELERLLSASAGDVRVQISNGDWMQYGVSSYDEHGITLQDEGDDEAIYLPWTSVIQLRFTPMSNDYDVNNSIG